MAGCVGSKHVLLSPLSWNLFSPCLSVSLTTSMSSSLRSSSSSLGFLSAGRGEELSCLAWWLYDWMVSPAPRSCFLERESPVKLWFVEPNSFPLLPPPAHSLFNSLMETLIFFRRVAKQGIYDSYFLLRKLSNCPFFWKYFLWRFIIILINKTYLRTLFEPPVSLNPLAKGLWSILSWVIFSFW